METEVVVDREEGAISVTLSRTEKQLIVKAETGQVEELQHPFGKYAMATLNVIPSPVGQHLLVTVQSGFSPRAWMLALEKAQFRQVFQLEADHDIEVAGSAIRSRTRQYEIPGGYWLLSRYYRVNPATGSYELVDTQGGPIRADLSKGRAGVYQAIAQLPDMIDYRARLEAHGYRLVFRPKETASWYVVAVGEDRPEKVTITSWFVVRKADGMVLTWDLAEDWPDD